MQSVANRLPSPLVHLLLVVLLPASAFAAQAQSFMAITVQVVRGDYSTAAAALIGTAASRGPAKSAINSDGKCKATGTVVIVDRVRATCSWDPDSHVYLVTVQY